MQIPDKLFYKIGEVCEYTDTQPYVLRFWESEFTVLNPQKNRSGQRIYSRDDIDLVMKIKHLLYDEEYTIAGARKRLEQEVSRDGGVQGDVENDVDDDAATSRGGSKRRTKKAARPSGRARAARQARLPEPEEETALPPPLPSRRPPTLSDRVERAHHGADPSRDREIEGLERRLADMEERWRRAEQALEQSEEQRAVYQERCERVAARLETALRTLAELRGGDGG